MRRERDLGSLEPGKLADFVVLERDPCSVEPSALRGLRVVRTYVHGRVVYEG
jgi:predicted amidohydrolase YtcJ